MTTNDNFEHNYTKHGISHYLSIISHYAPNVTIQRVCINYVTISNDTAQIRALHHTLHVEIHNYWKVTC